MSFAGHAGTRLLMRLRVCGVRARLLMAALLLLGQTGLMLHDIRHWQNQDGDKTCELCAHHVHQTQIAAAQAQTTALQRPDFLAYLAPAAPAPHVFRQPCRNRGPPAASA